MKKEDPELVTKKYKHVIAVEMIGYQAVNCANLKPLKRLICELLPKSTDINVI